MSDLADLYPEAKLAPRIGDPLRGPYLRWLAYYGSCFEPAVVDRAAPVCEPRAPLQVRLGRKVYLDQTPIASMAASARHSTSSG